MSQGWVTLRRLNIKLLAPSTTASMGFHQKKINQGHEKFPLFKLRNSLCVSEGFTCKWRLFSNINIIKYKGNEIVILSFSYERFRTHHIGLTLRPAHTRLTTWPWDTRAPFKISDVNIFCINLINITYFNGFNFTINHEYHIWNYVLRYNSLYFFY